MGRGSRSGRKRKRAGGKYRTPTLIPNRNGPMTSTTGTSDSSNESEVPPEARQENSPTSHQNKCFSDSQQRQQDTRIRDATIPPVATEKESTKPAAGPDKASNQQTPAKSLARDYKRCHSRWSLVINAISAGFTGAAAGAAFVTLLIMNCQLTAMRTQSDIMSGQLAQMKTDSNSTSDTTNRQLVIMEGQLREARRVSPRPWVGLAPDVGLTTTGPLHIDAKGNISVACSIIPYNFGDKPARIVRCTTKLIVTQGLKIVRNEMVRLCLEPDPPKIKGAHHLFPGEDRVARYSSLLVPPEERHLMQGEPEPPQFGAYIVGCIVYHDQFGDRHFTGFVFEYHHPEAPANVIFDPVPGTTIEGIWMPYDSWTDDEIQQ
jgi:hypothetical protein